MLSKNHCTSIFTLPVLAALFATSGSTAAERNTVDFRYSPPQWQTAICFPDDPQKTLVDKSGELLYHFRQGGREFGTRVSVQVTGAAVWQKQELLSPRAPIVRTSRTADGLRIVEEAMAVPLGPRSMRPARNDMLLIEVTNTGKETRTLQPKLIVDTTLGLRGQDQCVVVGNRETITASLKIIGPPQGKQD